MPAPLHADPRQIFLHAQKIGRAALHDLEQRVHRGNFLELLGQEPLQEIVRDVVVLGAGQFDQRVDLLRHFDFLVERELDRLPRRSERSAAARAIAGITTRPPASVTYLIKRIA